MIGCGKLLEGNALFNWIILVAQQVADNTAVAITGHAEVRGDETVGVQFRVLDVDFVALPVDAVIAIDRKTPLLIPENALADTIDKLRQPVLIPGGEHQGIAIDREGALLFVLVKMQGQVAVVAVHVLQGTVGENVAAQVAVQVLDVEQVPDGIDQVTIDALVEIFMLAVERVTFAGW